MNSEKTVTLDWLINEAAMKNRMSRIISISKLSDQYKNECMTIVELIYKAFDLKCGEIWDMIYDADARIDQLVTQVCMEQIEKRMEDKRNGAVQAETDS